jgi:hypothetical protein
VLSVNGLPSYPMEEFVVDTAPPFTILIPKDGEYRSGNSPIPNSPNFQKGVVDNIEMREPGNIARGYRPRFHKEETQFEQQPH